MLTPQELFQFQKYFDGNTKLFNEKSKQMVESVAIPAPTMDHPYSELCPILRELTGEVRVIGQSLEQIVNILQNQVSFCSTQSLHFERATIST